MAQTMCPDMNLSNPLADDSPAGIQDKEDVFLQRDLGSTYATKEFSKLFRETKLKVFEARAHNARVIKKCIRYFRSKGACVQGWLKWRHTPHCLRDIGPDLV